MTHEMDRSDIRAVVDAIVETANKYCNEDLPKEAVERLANEIDLRKEILNLAFENRRSSENPQGPADSDEYFAEKLGKLVNAAKMAIGADDREGYECPQLSENIRQFAYLVKGLVDAH